MNVFISYKNVIKFSIGSESFAVSVSVRRTRRN